MPRADGPAEETWETMTDEERDAAGDRLHRESHLFRLRMIVWTRQEQIDDRARRQLDEAFDELEVVR